MMQMLKFFIYDFHFFSGMECTDFIRGFRKWQKLEQYTEGVKGQRKATNSMWILKYRLNVATDRLREVTAELPVLLLMSICQFCKPHPTHILKFLLTETPYLLTPCKILHFFLFFTDKRKITIN